MSNETDNGPETTTASAAPNAPLPADQLPPGAIPGHVTQVLVPSPGRVVVVREKASETYGPNSRLVKTEADRDWESAVNPFSMVVGVGAPETTMYGTQITTDVQLGDKVVVAQVGMHVPLIAGGKIDYVYVVGFNGIVGRLELLCGNCGHTERHFAHEIKCTKCGAEAAPALTTVEPEEVELAIPSADDIAEMSKQRVDKGAAKHLSHLKRR